MPNTRLYKPVAYALDWTPEDIEWIYERVGKGDGITLDWIERQIRSGGCCYQDCPHELLTARKLLRDGSYGFWEIDCEYCSLLQIGKLSFLIHLEKKCSEVPKPMPRYREALIHVSFGDFTLFELRLWARYLAILKHRKSRWVKHVEFKAFGKTFIHWKSK